MRWTISLFLYKEVVPIMQYILSCMPTPIVKIQKSRKRWSGGALVAPEGRTGGRGGGSIAFYS